MFPALKDRILARVDLLVEFSTLGEYGVDEHGALMALEREPRLAPRVRDRCGSAASQGAAGARARGSARAVPART